MQKSLKYRQKLIPLRRLADNGPYSSSYLSLLVQRKKLKAEKVGRNYYTTEEWFKEYLEKHSQNEKWGIFQEKEKLQVKKIAEIKQITPDKAILSKKKRFKYKTAILSAAVFVLLIISGIAFYLYNREKGKVAGESESISTTTIEMIERGAEVRPALRNDH